MKERATRASVPAEEWRAGDNVSHAIWGEGKIVAIKEDEICAAFPGKGIKRLAAKFAPLKRI